MNYIKDPVRVAHRAKMAELLDTGKRAWGLVTTEVLLNRGRCEPLPKLRSVICTYARLNHNMTSRQISDAILGKLSPESIRKYWEKHEDNMQYDKEYAKLWESFIEELEKETILIS